MKQPDPILPGEVWAAVPGFEHRYEVSNLGRVRSLKILRPAPASHGYLSVALGRRNTRTVHSLVAEAFHGKGSPDQEVRHLNGVRTDNRSDNLAYGTRQDNMNDAKAHGTTCTGEKNWNCKLSETDIIDMRRMYEVGVPQASLAKHYAVSTSSISTIVRNKRHTYVKVIVPLPTDALPGEEWKPIAGAQGRYDISNLGRVRSYRKAGGWEASPTRILRPGTDKDGYERVNLRTGQQQNIIERRVHRLVIDHFVSPQPAPDMIARHLDGNRRNNEAVNLQWGTQKENAADRGKHGHLPRGEAHHNCKLSEARVLEIKRLRKQGLTNKTLAGRFGVAEATIQAICAGRIWRHLNSEEPLSIGVLQ